MAKRQVFGEEARKKKGTHRKMARVIISTKSSHGKYAFRETMVDQDRVNEFIDENTE